MLGSWDTNSSELARWLQACIAVAWQAEEKVAADTGHSVFFRINYRFPQFVPTKLETLVPQSNSDGINIMLAPVSASLRMLAYSRTCRIPRP